MIEAPLPSNTAISACGERFAKYAEAPGDREILQGYRTLRCHDLQGLFNAVGLAIQGTPSALSLRIKRVDSIVRKLRREGSMNLLRMDDIIGFRIITASCSTQTEVTARAQACLRVRRVRNYIENPAPSGYRAVHMTFEQQADIGDGRSRPYPCELQVRTYYQHLWATMSESFGEQVKEGGGSDEQRTYLTELSRLIREWEAGFSESLQVQELEPSAGLTFLVLHFNKRRGLLLQAYAFGGNLLEGLRQLIYLEELHRQDFDRESVLLAAAKGADELRVTHLRYFRPQGVPSLPDFLTPALSRPGTGS